MTNRIKVNINDKIFHTFDPTSSDYTHNTYIYNLPLDFIKSNNNKYVVVKKFRCFNNDGQMDLAACLTSKALSVENCYNYGLNYNQNYIMSSNEINDKMFKVNSDCKRIDFTFTDYKGELLNTNDDLNAAYYYVIELELIY